MDIILNNDDRKWLQDTWNKAVDKMHYVVKSDLVDFPYTVDENGKYIEAKTNEPRHSWWTNGFFAGIMWILYQKTHNEELRKKAQKIENALDEALKFFDGLHHDVGFMWLHTAAANYRITGNGESRKRALTASSILASRFNVDGRFIRAWNDAIGEDRRGWAIIDSMMNIPLLTWASKETNDPRFEQIARKHADKVAENFIRADGSVNHIVSFDINTGEFIESLAGQGYAVGSSWTRGQAWAIYGFALRYIHTKEKKYLNVAKKVADYFISQLSEDNIPVIDFRGSDIEHKDTTAGVIAACGLIEIANNVSQSESNSYIDAALKILKTTEKHYCDWTTECDAIVMGGSESYKSGKDMHIVYGTYFFIEAIDKLLNNSILLW